jgi:hypothetical protein
MLVHGLNPLLIYPVDPIGRKWWHLPGRLFQIGFKLAVLRLKHLSTEICSTDFSIAISAELQASDLFDRVFLIRSSHLK